MSASAASAEQAALPADGSISSNNNDINSNNNNNSSNSNNNNSNKEGTSSPSAGPQRAASTSKAALALEPRLVPAPFDQPKAPGWTRFVCFSDTHGKHNSIPPEHRPEGDVLLHAGDFTNTGEGSQVRSFAKWLGEYPAKHKVVIAGNHDITFEPEFYRRASERFFHRQPEDTKAVRASLIDSGTCFYLEEESVEVEGYTIYGSPYQPEFCDWAFNLPRDECAAHWKKIPENVDILMTHGPPFGILDRCSHGGHAGCPELLKAIEARRVPVYVCGHIHEAYGVEREGCTTYINASTCTLRYRASNPPIVFDLPAK